jgi:hypothetical protein
VAVTVRFSFEACICATVVVVVNTHIEEPDFKQEFHSRLNYSRMELALSRMKLLKNMSAFFAIWKIKRQLHETVFLRCLKLIA